MFDNMVDSREFPDLISIEVNVTISKIRRA